MSLHYWLFNKEAYLVDGEDIGIDTIEETDSINITHNLNTMASKCWCDFMHSGYSGDKRNLYQLLWNPLESGFRIVNALYIETLDVLLRELKSNPEYYKQYDSKNGWGKYENLVKFVEKVLELCKNHQGWYINVSK